MNKLNILSWNIRWLEKHKRKKLARNVFIDYKVDIVSLQETKLEHFKDKFLKTISPVIENWFILPSRDRSGGILICINEDYLEVVTSWIARYCISILIKNKTTGFEWLFTSIYGPSIARGRINLWKKLRNIKTYWQGAWLLSGDFNMVRYRNERKGKSYNHIVSRRFNAFINDMHLIDFKPNDRKFTWSNYRKIPSFALLNRFLVNIEWEKEVRFSITTSLLRYQSDHNAIILMTDTTRNNRSSKVIRFEKSMDITTRFLWIISYFVETISLRRRYRPKLKT